MWIVYFLFSTGRSRVIAYPDVLGLDLRTRGITESVWLVPGTVEP